MAVFLFAILALMVCDCVSRPSRPFFLMSPVLLLLWKFAFSFSSLQDEVLLVLQGLYHSNHRTVGQRWRAILQ